MMSTEERTDFVNPGARNRKIAVLGAGHVGLPTALGLAELGWEVVCSDSDPIKLAMIKQGRCPFFEAGLQELLTKHLGQGRFRPTGDVDLAIQSSEILFLCVGTPQRENGQADLSQIEDLARTIACNLNGYKLIVEKSTVPAITAHWIKRTILRYVSLGKSSSASGGNGDGNAGPDFDVASNPEFLQQGKAIQDFFHPDRIVCGVEAEKAQRILEDIYRPLGRPIVMTNLTTAELIKHAANAFLCTKISFINMVADLCEMLGADIASLANGIGLDHRIGHDFLNAGVGFGGYCFPKDLRAFIYLAEEHGADFSLLKQVERINLRRIEVFVKKIQQALWVIQGKRIAILGLAFKPGTDDIREAPSIKIIERLRQQGANLCLYDPCAMPNMSKVFSEDEHIVYRKSAYEAVEDADALVILTEWEEFRELDLSRVRKAMRVPTIVDGRNIFAPQMVQQAGFEYYSVGRELPSLPLRPDVSSRAPRLGKELVPTGY